MAPRRPSGTVRPSATEGGRRISYVRKHLGMSKVAFARRLAISRNTLIHYEQGGGIPRSTILVRIAQAGGVSVDWLLSGRTTEEIRTDPDWERALQRLRLAWHDPTRRPLVLAVLVASRQNERPHRAPEV
jgi:transcriptional regulator with XRE-family HTH domain